MSASHARAAMRVALGVALAVAVLAVGRALDGPALLGGALEGIRGLGPWGPVLFVAIYVAATVLLLPAVVLTLGAGAVFGVVTGAISVSIGATLGATAAFLLGRHLVRERVARRLEPYPAFRAIDAAVGREGWKVVALTRLSPAFPFVLLNYAFGLSRVPLRAYVVASWIGMLPGIVTYVYLGSVAGELATLGAGGRVRSRAEWVLYGVGLAATLAVTIWVTRVARGALRQRVAAAPSAGLALLVLASAASPAGADDDAYGRLLTRHVRPGTIDGIALAVVDYTRLGADPDYARALGALAAAEPERLRTDAERLAFWVNAYNLLALKTVVDRYPVASIREGGHWLWPIWKRTVGAAAGRERTLDEIEHDILRPRFREPRVHMAIVCASLSCPDLRREPYAGERLQAQLGQAAREFLANATKGVEPGPGGRAARVSSIFKWFADDFGGPDGVVRFIRDAADPALAERLAPLQAAGLDYLPYDWSLNDARRASRP